VDKVEREDRYNDDATIEDDEINLVGNEMAGPSLGQFNGPINSPNELTDYIDCQRHDHHPRARAERASLSVILSCGEWLVQTMSDEVLGGQDHEGGNNDELDNDTDKHDVSSKIGSLLG